ncbi:MAG: PAS domain-containing protein [Burkholderiales bacterium]
MMHADIHDQKRNQEELKRVNWMLSSHIGNTPLAVLEWDRDSRLVRWSQQAQNIFGFAAEEILGIRLSDNPLLHEEDREGFAGLVDRLMGGEEPRATGLTRNHTKDGGTIWCEWYHSALLDQDGRIVSILSFVQDVSCASRRRSGCSTSPPATRSPGSRTACCCTSASTRSTQAWHNVHPGRRVRLVIKNVAGADADRRAPGRGGGILEDGTRERRSRAGGDGPGDRRGLRQPVRARAHRASCSTPSPSRSRSSRTTST